MGRTRYVVRDGVRRATKSKRWYVVRYDPATGQKTTSHSFDTEAEAKRHRDEIAAPVRTRSYVESSRRPLREYVGEWLPAVSVALRPTTHAGYAKLLRLHVLPHIGDVPLADITATSLNALYGRLATTGSPDGHGALGPATVRHVHVVIGRVLRDAVRDGLLATNAASVATPPKASASRRFEAKTWTADEAQRFLEGARQHKGRDGKIGLDRLYAAWVLALSAGLRRGELLGLRWQDVDLDRGTLAVRHTLVPVAERGNFHVASSDAKTSAGRRVVDLDAWTVAELRAHRVRQAEERLAKGAAWQDHGLVFTMHDGRAYHPDRFSREFVTRCERNGVPVIRLHDTRHTSATLALAAGIPTKVVSERLGHSSTAITANLYQHVTQTMQREAADKLGAILRPAGS
jgi:integrase